MTVRKLAFLCAASLLAVASAASATPGEVQRDRSHMAGGAGMSGNAYDAGITQPGEAAYLRAAHIYRFEGAAASVAGFERAVAEGSPLAMRQLGLMYVHGDGVARDRQRGLELLYEAARRDDPAAMLAMADAFRLGFGVERDQQLARFWLLRASDTGYRPAMEARRRLATQ